MALNLFRTKIIPDQQIVYIYDLVKNIIAPGNRAFISPHLQIIIDDILKARLPQNWNTNKEFINQLNRSFQQRQFSTYDEKYFPEYYAGYYLPNNLYKIQLMLLELFKLGRISFSEKKIRVLDIGAAVGTTAWALFDFYDILVNVLQLYGLRHEKLPVLEVDSIEKSTGNIELFEEIRKRINLDHSKVIVNKPINGDVLNGGFHGVDLESYDIIIASNIINEFPSYHERLKFAKTILGELKKSAAFILIETAFLKDTRDLKKIQRELSTLEGIQVISPCGKLNQYTDRCSNCWSFRRESLHIPITMKLFHSSIDQSDDNEKLKWSYSIYVKDKQDIFTEPITTPSLKEISNGPIGSQISVIVEIVSGKIFDRSDEKHYYLKICDQSENTEGIILKIPQYFEIPNFQYGDVIKIDNGKLIGFSNDRMGTVHRAILLDPKTTTISNLTMPVEQRGLVRFDDIQEDNIKYFLWRFFGFKEFTEGQFDILKRVLRNENVLGILATGGGKSLTFQLPALLKPGVSIIISPLKSLMDDQVRGMKRRFGFDFVDRIHSGMELVEKKHVLDRFRNGYLKILYIAPERLQQKTFQKELSSLINKGININYFPIDEAHCISEWGHDFRPSYARLKERQQDLPHIDGNHPSIIALTATASKKVRDDILDQLVMDQNIDVIHKIIDRVELSLEVITLTFSTQNNSYSIRFRNPIHPDQFVDQNFEPGLMKHEVLLYILKNILPIRFDEFDIVHDAGLIFTIYADPLPAEDDEKFRSDKSRESEGARWISEYLNKNGIKCKPWYATQGYRKDQSSEERRKIQKDWETEKVKTQEAFIVDKINLLVTTKGFGMGIDKPNIRYIVHFGFPGSLESYFQQIGRAGRDRNHSHCILLWDSPTEDCKNFIDNSDSEKTIPECFKLNEANNKNKYDACPYGRTLKCDYAKQIFFIESGYPTVEELQTAVNYIVMKAKEQNTFPWVYLKLQYLGSAVGRGLTYSQADKMQVNEQLLVETLYTLKYIHEFSQTYLNVGIARKNTLEEIYNSTNSEIVREHIELLGRVFPNIRNAPPNDDNNIQIFDIAKYVTSVRKDLNIEILIDEVVQFFNILNEREDFNLYFNYQNDFGFEIKINSDMMSTSINHAEHLNKVIDWKKSQYAMLKNMVDYAELKPFDQESDHCKCRRVLIMQVFGTSSATDTIKCNYCDNCGYHNPWNKKADDVTAGILEQVFAVNLEKFYNNQSKNQNYLLTEMDLFIELVSTMISKNYISLAETKSDAWLEQIGETDNPATNLMLAVIEHCNNNETIFIKRFGNFIKYAGDNHQFMQNTLLLFKRNIGIEPSHIYKNFYESNHTKELSKTIKMFSSDYSEDFLEIETEIGLNIIELQTTELSKVYNSLERLIENG